MSIIFIRSDLLVENFIGVIKFYDGRARIFEGLYSGRPDTYLLLYILTNESAVALYFTNRLIIEIRQRKQAFVTAI